MIYTIRRSRIALSLLVATAVLCVLSLIVGVWQIVAIAMFSAFAALYVCIVVHIRSAIETLKAHESEMTRRIAERAGAESEKFDALASYVEERRAEITKSRSGIVPSIESIRSELTSQSVEIEKLTTAHNIAFEAIRSTGGTVDRTMDQLNRVVRRQIEIHGMVELLEGGLTARIDQFLDETQRDLRKYKGEISALTQRFDALEWGSPPSREGSKVAAWGDSDVSRYLYYLSYHIPREVEAQQQLQRLFEPEGPMPLLGGWALSPTGTLDIVNVIMEDRPESVVECGSGTSSLWIGYALRANRGGHLYTLEHDPAFADVTRRQVASNGLSDYVTVIDAPLVDHDKNGEVATWYDTRGLSDVRTIGVLAVDGPPRLTGDLRREALGLLHDRLVDGAHVFADDVNRSGEHEMISDWLQQFPGLHTSITSTPVQAHLVWKLAETL